MRELGVAQVALILSQISDKKPNVAAVLSRRLCASKVREIVHDQGARLRYFFLCMSHTSLQLQKLCGREPGSPG